MKIGIVTPFDSRNFGNRLQNYALQQVLLGYGDQVVTIKNKPALPSLTDRLRRAAPLAESVLVNRLVGEKRKARFLQFNREYLHITRRGYWYNRRRGALRKEDTCDWYCAGSDQIWNPQLDREGDFNFLRFAQRERTFSYAASFGVAAVPEEKQEAVQKGLNHIRYLSVRETAGKRIVEELTGRTDAEVLPDPTLLLRLEDWEVVMKKTRRPLPEAYLLAYFLGDVPGERRSAISQRAEALGLEVVELMDRNSPFYESGPGEFLYLIRHAALVCTDSFHGGVFSFLFQRPLILFERAGEGNCMGSRLETLTKTYHLEACRAEGNSLPKIPASADYTQGYGVLQKERLRANAFLDRIFRSEERE